MSGRPYGKNHKTPPAALPTGSKVSEHMTNRDRLKAWEKYIAETDATLLMLQDRVNETLAETHKRQALASARIERLEHEVFLLTALHTRPFRPWRRWWWEVRKALRAIQEKRVQKA